MNVSKDLKKAAAAAKCTIVQADENLLAFVARGGGGHCFYRTSLGWLTAYRTPTSWSSVLGTGETVHAPTLDALAKAGVATHPSALAAIRSLTSSPVVTCNGDDETESPTTKERGTLMNKILAKISAPLLLGSILALGALAFPSSSNAADGPRFIFRASAGLVSPTIVAENGGTGGGTETSPGGETDAGGSGGDGEAGSGGDDEGSTETPAGQAFLKINFLDGWSFECETNWSAGDLAAYRHLIENETQRDYDAERDEIFYVGIAPAAATGNADPISGIMAFRFNSSVFGFDWRAPFGYRAPGDSTGPWPDATGDIYPIPVVARDPREYPSTPPCVSSDFSVEVGEYRPGASSSLPIQRIEIEVR